MVGRLPTRRLRDFRQNGDLSADEPDMADALVGRVDIIELGPFTQGELTGLRGQFVVGERLAVLPVDRLWKANTR